MSGPRALPPSMAKLGPPGCFANDAICAAALWRFTSGCAPRVAEHSLRQVGALKKAKLTRPGTAGSVPTSGFSAGGWTIDPSSQCQIDEVRHVGGRAGRIAEVPWPAAVIDPA